MKYRPLSPLGDYTIGRAFLDNSPDCVGQAVLTRLKLWLGEFFLDTADGTPYLTQVLGARSSRTPDNAIKRRILGTPGVTELTAYSSVFDGTTRKLTVTATVQTLYSKPITVTTTLGGTTA